MIFDEYDEIDIEDLINFIEKYKRTKPVSTLHTGVNLLYGVLEINYKCRTVKIGGTNIELTHYEFEILYLLVKHPGQVFSKRQIYEWVWNTPYIGAENNVISLIHRIRKKIEPNPAKPIHVLTVWREGYKFSNTINTK